MRVDRFALPLAEPVDTARGTMTERRGFLVTVERDGETGIGEAAPLPGWTESDDDCRAALERAGEHETAADALSACEGAPAARHAVSLAHADAAARARDVPLYRHLADGGAPGDGTVTAGDPAERVDDVPVNATVGDADPDTTVARVRAAVSAGFDTVKLKVGARSLDADRERVAAARDAAPDAALRVDANGAWTPTEARRALDALGDVAYVEQPLAAPSLDGHAALRDSGPIALDESVAAVGLDAVLDTAAADVVVLKPMALGGVDRTVAAGRRARRAGVEPVVTTTFDGVYARTAAVHAAAALAPLPACGLATADALARDHAPDPASITDGRIAVPQGKGNGVAGPHGE